MKVKTKLIASIMSICLVCAVFAIGVFALKTANLKIGGDVSFQATGVEAHIRNASVSGTVTPTTLAANDAEGEVINTSMTQSDINTTFANWSDIELDFDESATDIELKFQIANTSTNADNYIEIDYSYSFSNSSPNVDVFPGDENDQSVWENNEYILAPKGATPADGDYETFTLKFKVLDKELNVPQDTKVNVTIALKHTTPSVGTLADGKLTTPDGIIYRVDANGTASLGSTITEGEYLIAEGDNYSYDGEADVVIAPVVSDGTNNYIVTVIDRYAFAYCNDAEGMPDGNAVMQSIHIPNSVKEIKEDAFLFCDELVSVNIPKSVSSIEDLIFYGTSLSEIYIPSSVTSIGNEAFCTCSSLTTIIIPSSVTSIGDNAFSSCSSLTTITIPSSVTSIGGNAFSYTGLTTITIPSSVTSIGRYAFSGCTNLTSVKFEETSGWWYADSADATSGTEIAESEFTTDASAANANLLKTTYYNKYWFRTVA